MKRLALLGLLSIVGASYAAQTYYCPQKIHCSSTNIASCAPISSSQSFPGAYIRLKDGSSSVVVAGDYTLTTATAPLPNAVCKSNVTATCIYDDPNSNEIYYTTKDDQIVSDLTDSKYWFSYVVIGLCPVNTPGAVSPSWCPFTIQASPK